MKDFKRVSWLAILLLVVLRISIGWQFLYEGMWKYGQMDSPKPWTSEGYLKNAQGPFRDHFREMTGDPDDLNWLDYGKMSQKAYAWRDRFVKHYQLNPEQETLVNLMLDGSAAEDTAPEELPPFPTFSRKLSALPESVNLKRYAKTIQFDAKGQVLKVMQPILPSEETAIKKMVDVVKTDDENIHFAKKELVDGKQVPADDVEAKFYAAFDALVNYSRKPIDKAVSDLSAQSKKKDSNVNRENFLYAAGRMSTTLKRALPYRHRLAASLHGDPERIGVYGELNKKGSFDLEMGTVTRDEESAEKHNIKFGRIKEYRELLQEYEDVLTQVKMDYQIDHATKLGLKAALMRTELVGPVRSLESELHDNALKLLTVEQISLGAMPPEDTPIHKADMMAMWGLLILGALLIVGFFTRFAAILGAVMVLSFYLVIPPWPGVPPAPGPEHSLYINKNMIEVIALLAIAMMPTGTWFGIDAFFSGRFFKGKDDTKKA